VDYTERMLDARERLCKGKATLNELRRECRLPPIPHVGADELFITLREGTAWA